MKAHQRAEWFNSLHFVANQSALVVIFSVSFAAMVTILESSFHMKLVVHNDSLVPGFAAMLILKELGAVVTALLLASRVGAAMTAELALMKTTEQLDALKMLGVPLFERIILPRWFAGVVGCVLLTAVANAACLLVASWISQIKLGFSGALFLSAMNRFVHPMDFLHPLIKAAAFGSAIPLIAAWWGLKAKSGAEGIGHATTMGVVTASVTIIVLDFVLSYAFSQV